MKGTTLFGDYVSIKLMFKFCEIVCVCGLLAWIWSHLSKA